MTNIAIEKNNKIGFFKIDRRKIDKFIQMAEEVNGTLDSVWTYTHIERDGESTIGTYKNIIIIK